MIEVPCGYPDCQNRAVLLTGVCLFCCRHLCDKHLSDKEHKCGKPDCDRMSYVRARKRELDRLQDVLDTLDVISKAASIRPGHSVKPVDLDVTRLPRGTRNIHIPIEFGDGVKWIARVRQVGINAYPLIVREVMQGEVETMNWFKEKGAAPVADVMSQVFCGTEFYFMAMLPGRSCPSPIWANNNPKDKLNQTIADLAKINVRRSEHPLRGIGSLLLDPSTETFTVGPLITPDICREMGIPPRPHYRLYQRRYRINKELALLVHQWIRDVIVEYPPFMVEGDTYVVHEDANGDHIMVDEEGRITGLIDWEWATVGSKCEAFASPFALIAFESLRGGLNELSSAEIQLIEEYKRLGRPDLADCVTAGKPYTWLSIMLGSDVSWSEYKYIKALGEALGLMMKASMEEFLDEQRKKCGEIE